MKKFMFLVLMVCTITMMASAQKRADYNSNVDTTYSLSGELGGDWIYGVAPEAQCAYRNHVGGLVMIVYQDSIMLEGHMYAVPYSKMHRNRKVVLLIDWTGEDKHFAELSIVLRRWPFGPWYSAMLVAPKVDERYSPDPVLFELYKVDKHWLGSK